jgi:hypothetical protein
MNSPRSDCDRKVALPRTEPAHGAASAISSIAPTDHSTLKIATMQLLRANYFLARRFHPAVMVVDLFVGLPVHAGGGIVVNLNPVHAAVTSGMAARPLIEKGNLHPRHVTVHA